MDTSPTRTRRRKQKNKQASKISKPKKKKNKTKETFDLLAASAIMRSNVFYALMANN
jgi:hypothetical protein